MQDDDSGLVYAGARYYDPVVGRFLAIDPAGRPVSFNRYAYANNSPYGFVDPDGRSPVVAMEIAVAGAQILTGTAIVNSTGGMTAFPAHQGGGEVYGGSSIDPTISGPWHTGRPASGFNWPTWMSSEGEDASVGEEEYGSYTNNHASGKKYHGQGDRKRSQTSGKEREAENNDPHVATDWTRASNRRDAMKDEARRIHNDGGIESANNYNKINSPGRKYLEQDGGR